MSRTPLQNTDLDTILRSAKGTYVARNTKSVTGHVEATVAAHEIVMARLRIINGISTYSEQHMLGVIVCT